MNDTDLSIKYSDIERSKRIYSVISDNCIKHSTLIVGNMCAILLVLAISITHCMHAIIVYDYENIRLYESRVVITAIALAIVTICMFTCFLEIEMCCWKLNSATCRSIRNKMAKMLIASFCVLTISIVVISTCMKNNEAYSSISECILNGTKGYSDAKILSVITVVGSLITLIWSNVSIVKGIKEIKKQDEYYK